MDKWDPSLSCLHVAHVACGGATIAHTESQAPPAHSSRFKYAGMRVDMGEMAGQVGGRPSPHPKSPLSTHTCAAPAGVQMRNSPRFPPNRSDTPTGPKRPNSTHPHEHRIRPTFGHTCYPLCPPCPTIGRFRVEHAMLRWGQLHPIDPSTQEDRPSPQLSELPHPSPGVRSAPYVREVRTCPRCADSAIWGPSAADTRIDPFLTIGR
jgi:hypothetical protein